LTGILQPHSVGVRGWFPPEDVGNNCIRDYFGVIWDRSRDKDIGVIKGHVLENPSLANYRFPDPHSERMIGGVAERCAANPDLFRTFDIGFSLYERAWTLRGMENLLVDFYENPGFARDLLRSIADFNIAVMQDVLKYDIDAFYFGDDWGDQRGLQMGRDLWMEFIQPELKRMYAVARHAGKYVTIHSCGKVDEIFDDLIDIGVNCFNPFQPEVMDVAILMKKHHGRLAFHGGLSTQKTLPYGSPEDVRRETRKLLELGQNGGYIFAPSHAVEGDAPVENIVAFVDTLRAQPGFRIA